MAGTASVAAVDDQDIDGPSELESALKGTGVDDDLGVSTGDDPEPDDTPKDDDPKPDDTSSDDEPKPDDKPADDTLADDTLKEPDLADENAALRQQLREQRREMAIMNAKLNRIANRKPAAPAQPKDDFDDEDEPGDQPAPAEPEDKPTGVELLQEQLTAVAQVRGGALAEMVELMSLNPKYEDVETVCTRERFDDLFEMAAAHEAKTNGVDPVEAAMELELKVWQMTNPYRYMYDMIKSYHPDFVKAAPADNKATPKPTDKTDVKGEPPSDAAKARGNEPKPSPTSAYDIPGGGSKAHGGWTAERIDEMPEEDLHKVPEDVYESYLRGELDPVT